MGYGPGSGPVGEGGATRTTGAGASTVAAARRVGPVTGAALGASALRRAADR